MDSRHRDIIEEYRNLMVKNLILTDDFYRVLVTHGVFTDGLIKDIKKAPRGQTGHQLIDLLLTRTNAGYGKFCDVLEVTGHNFLSDCLREADNHDATTELDLNDLVSKVPFISKALKNDQQKEALQNYFKIKIQSEVIKQTWRGDISTKERLMIARQQQIEQVWHYEEETKVRDRSINDLQKDYMQLQAYTDDVKREIKTLHKHIEDLNRKHKEELSTQVKFNMANDRHLTRLNTRAEDADTYLARIHDSVRDLMNKEYKEKPARTPYQNLEDNFKVFLDKHRDLRTLTTKFRDERSYMSNQVAGTMVRDSEDLKPLFQDYLVRSEEAKLNLETKCAEMENKLITVNGELEELKAVQDKIDSLEDNQEQTATDEYAKLKQEIERTSAVAAAREEQVQTLRVEMKSLMLKVKELENALREAQRNEQSAKIAAQNIPKPKTPTKPPQKLAPIEDKPRQSSSYYKKPSTQVTRTSSNIPPAGDLSSLSSLDAIKGQGLAGGTSYPPGVKRMDDSVLQAGMRQPSTVNGRGKLAVTRTTTRKY